VKKQKPKSKKKTARKSKPATKKSAKKPATKRTKEETMDRNSLKVVASQLKDMGSDIKVMKSDSDADLQKKVNEALQKLPPPVVLKKLESIAPEKLVSVLKRDCIGIFIDLADVSCVRCPDAASCAKQFLNNVKAGFPDVEKAAADPVVEKTVAKAAITPVSRYEADRMVFMRDRPNPNPKNDPYFDTIEAILKEEPSTLSELREIVERDFDIESDGDFMKFVTAMRDPKEGIIKLDVDLSKKDKKALREAGLDIFREAGLDI
jgi:hypothetical protein